MTLFLVAKHSSTVMNNKFLFTISSRRTRRIEKIINTVVMFARLTLWSNSQWTIRVMYEVHFGELCVKLALEPWYFFEGIVSADFVVDCTCFDGHATLISERKDCVTTQLRPQRRLRGLKTWIVKIPIF